ncbi:hypothetical protein I6G82_02885 [Lysinibacillus macroides]|uniref:hypothetical protein n=1 Tax=Lysinibacillus macroides TaxID=33935 RepID=UPI0006B41990|nr:hypothetical protein [Lysinibacillus macroides]QPR68594.1 hypothetical protein I6G82_02885 [Lysinibacillus macroides]
MKAQRDGRGRFLPGNTESIGNKGNTHPKYGNQNARKHGFFSKVVHGQRIEGDDLILTAYHKGVAIRFLKGEWELLEDGFIIIGPKAEAASHLLGLPLKKVKIHS